MKCIGGELDGQEQTHIREDIKRGDVVQIYLPVKFEIRNFYVELEDLYTDKHPEVAKYRVCSINFSSIHNDKNHTIKYLIPHDWHEWEAIEHLFRNYSRAS